MLGDHAYLESPGVDNIDNKVTVNVTGPNGLDLWTTGSVAIAPDYQGMTSHPVATTAGTPLADAPLITFDAPLPTIDGSPWVAAIDWGDGSSRSVGTVRPTTSATNPFAVTVSGTHTYAKPGTYLVVVDLVGKTGGHIAGAPDETSGGLGATVATVA